MRDASPGDPGNDDAERSVSPSPPPSLHHRRQRRGEIRGFSSDGNGGGLRVSRSFSLPFYPRLMSQAFSIFRPPPAPFAPANAKVSEPAACTSCIADCTGRHALFALPLAIAS